MEKSNFPDDFPPHPFVSIGTQNFVSEKTKHGFNHTRRKVNE